VHRDPYGVVPILYALRAGADDVVPFIAETEGFELLELVLARSVAAHRTEREARRLREQIQCLGTGELSDVVRRTAHDMNQPLTVIMGTVDLLLLELPNDSTLRADLESVLRESQKLRALATSLGSLAVTQAAI
jgi:signal transduction histidine kinase